MHSPVRRGSHDMKTCWHSATVRSVSSMPLLSSASSLPSCSSKLCSRLRERPCSGHGSKAGSNTSAVRGAFSAFSAFPAFPASSTFTFGPF
eukprot:g64020.t1